MPVRITCLSNKPIAGPDCPICPGGNTVQFSGLEFVWTGGRKDYIRAPYDVEYNGSQVSITEINTGREIVIRLQDTSYRLMSELRDRLQCGAQGATPPPGEMHTYTSANCLIVATAEGVTVNQNDTTGKATVTVPEGVDIYSLVFQGTTSETDSSDDYTVEVVYEGTRAHDNGISTMRPPMIFIWDTGAQLVGGPSSAFPFVQDSDNTPQKQMISVGSGGSQIEFKIINLSSTYGNWAVNMKF